MVINIKVRTDANGRPVIKFAAKTGASPCQSLKHIKTFPLEIRDGLVHVATDEKLAKRNSTTF